MECVNAKKKIDDIFTKALPKDAHEYLRGKLPRLFKKHEKFLASTEMIDICYTSM